MSVFLLKSKKGLFISWIQEISLKNLSINLGEHCIYRFIFAVPAFKAGVFIMVINCCRLAQAATAREIQAIVLGSF